MLNNEFIELKVSSIRVIKGLLNLLYAFNKLMVY